MGRRFGSFRRFSPSGRQSGLLPEDDCHPEEDGDRHRVVRPACSLSGGEPSIRSFPDRPECSSSPEDDAEDRSMPRLRSVPPHRSGPPAAPASPVPHTLQTADGETFSGSYAWLSPDQLRSLSPSRGEEEPFPLSGAEFSLSDSGSGREDAPDTSRSPARTERSEEADTPSASRMPHRAAQTEEESPEKDTEAPGSCLHGDSSRLQSVPPAESEARAEKAWAVSENSRKRIPHDRSRFRQTVPDCWSRRRCRTSPSLPNAGAAHTRFPPSRAPELLP